MYKKRLEYNYNYYYYYYNLPQHFLTFRIERNEI